MKRSRRAIACAGFLSTALCTAGGLLVSAGCETPAPATKPILPKPSIAKATDLKPFMKGTIYDMAIMMNTEPHNVSAYGLVGQLRGTGDCTASNIVRQYMIKEMFAHSFGDSQLPGYEKISPADVLRDPHYALVRVDAFIPAGARKDDWIDAQVTCLPGNRTTSLAHGVLFETDLKDSGADMENPAGAVNPRVVVKGPILINPAYTLENPTSASAEARDSVRTGQVLFNAKVKQDRPIMVRLRDPQGGIARRIQDIISYRFQDVTVAQAQDEAIVNVYVPRSYHGDWQRFKDVVNHLFLRNDPAFNVAKARELAAEAVKPDAALDDIAACWEGIGSNSLEAIQPLMNHPNPKVAFYAARAAAFIGDGTQAAEMRLTQIAQTPNHPYRLAAVQALGHLPPTSSLNSLLRKLLDSEMSLVRIEAYQILSRYHDSFGSTDPAISRTVVAPISDPNNQKFFLDVVPSNAPPLIYVSRSGPPRIAILGQIPVLNARTPATMMDNRLTLAGQDKGRYILMYFRDPMRENPVQVNSQPTLDSVVARLGGMGAEGTEILNFSYGEVIAVLQRLTDSNMLLTRGNRGEEIPAIFKMEEPPRVQSDLMGAEQIPDPGLVPTSQAPPQFGSPTSPKPVAGGPAIGPPPAAGTPSNNAPSFGPAPAAGTDAPAQSNAPRF